MTKGKLILICQWGGEFITRDDGSLSYIGGEANALEVNQETLFSDLKLKLAEMWNLDLVSLSIKYFLPFNKQTLISLSNDKDLKRMYDFHESSVTADIFITGSKGFDHESLSDHAGRMNGVKLAETVATGIPAVTTPIAAARAHPPTSSDSQTQEPTNSMVNVTVIDYYPPKVSIRSKVSPLEDGYAKFVKAHATRTSSPHIDVAIDLPTQIVVTSTPADAVKKRRRLAPKKNDSSAPTSPVIDTVRETRKSPSWKKKAKKHNNYSEINDEDQHKSSALCNDNLIDCPVVIGSNDPSLEAMIGAWRAGITGEGQEFRSVREFRDALQKYAIANRFGYKLKKNDANRASGCCAVVGCSWRIQASWVPSSQSFVVKKLVKSHTCNGESWKVAHPAKSWLVNIIKDRLRDSPHFKAKEIAFGIFRDFGVALNYLQVWRGIEDAKKELQGSYRDAYSQLPWLCDKLEEVNPGSIVKLFTDDDRRFHRLLLSFKPLIQGFSNSCRPLIFLDSISLRSKHHEILFTANAVDGDDGFFPVALAIVDVDNDANWHWFLEQLRTIISISSSITFVSEMEKGLEKSILQIFENGHHGYSIFHLLENFKKNVRGPFHGDGKGFLSANLLAAACSFRLDSFKTHIEQIRRVSTKAYDWIMQIEPEHWADALSKGEPFSYITANVMEPYAKWIEEVKELPIMQKVEALVSKLVELFSARQTSSTMWLTKLTPSREEKLREESQKAYGLKVLFSSETVFEVHDNSINVVDLLRKNCSCLEWKPIGLPCHHAIAVFNCTGRNAYDYCPKYFTVDSYRRTYSNSINAVIVHGERSIKAEDTNQVHVLPPCTVKPLSEHKKMPTTTHSIKKREVCCTRCHGVGHNKATCKEDL